MIRDSMPQAAIGLAGSPWAVERLEFAGMDHRSHHSSIDDHESANVGAGQSSSAPTSTNAIAFRATVHCLTGCGIGEVIGMVIGTAFVLGNAATIVIATALAFMFGYGLTVLPLIRSGLPARTAARIALAADTASIVVMEVVDNLIMLIIPGAMDATLNDAIFWTSLALSLLIAAVAAFPVNRWLIQRGKGHAAVHAHHG